MVTRNGSVRGDLIRWARVQQKITMRWIQEHGGPSLGYQSEVETGKKAEVSSEVLVGWLKLLNITDAFARGEIPTYAADPKACRGLAGNIGALIQSGCFQPSWAGPNPLERVRQVLCLIRDRSAKLPRVVLAHILGVELTSLDAMMTGQAPIQLHHLQALADLTALPEEFFKSGRLAEDDPAHLYGLSRQMREAGVTPEEVIAWLPYTGSLRSICEEGITPDELEDLLTGLPMLRGNLAHEVPPAGHGKRSSLRRL